MVVVTLCVSLEDFQLSSLVYSATHKLLYTSNSSTVSALDPDEDLSPGKKKVHFARDGRENHGPGSRHSVCSPELTLKKRLQAANAHAQALGEMERTYQKSRQFVGIR